MTTSTASTRVGKLETVPEIAERMYELGLGALAEQERQLAEVRSRGPALLAGGTVVASLLARPVFHGDHPSGFWEVAATIAGVGGAAAVLAFVVLLLRPYQMGFSVRATDTYIELFNQSIVEQPLVDLT